MVVPVILLIGMGLIAGLVLTLASKVFFVPVDEAVAQIREVLPGANCGACGFAGCDDYAAAIGDDRSLSPSLCPVGGNQVASAVAAILGVEAGSVQAKAAVVRCQGSYENTKQIMDYTGIPTCAAAKSFYGGNWACAQGCLAFGDCVSVCQYDAIRICNGVAVVDREVCVGCGMCEQACPNQVITMSDKKKLVYVACNSTEPGAKARKTCKVACIGCRKCQRVCPFEAIEVENNLARILFDKCRTCGLCEKECPTQAIANLRVQKKTVAVQQS